MFNGSQDKTMKKWRAAVSDLDEAEAQIDNRPPSVSIWEYSTIDSQNDSFLCFLIGLKLRQKAKAPFLFLLGIDLPVIQ